MQSHGQPVTRLGVVSFLNARPLTEGLEAAGDVRLYGAPPSALASMLSRGLVDAALVPVIDLVSPIEPWVRISDACIGCDGETLTVQVFSRVPPAEMTVLHADTDSHTSVVLARLVWQRMYGRRLTIAPLPAPDEIDRCSSVLLIGDKVVRVSRGGFEHELDLGVAWNQMTGLPFVFAVWAAPACGDHEDLGRRLSEARDRGVARAAQIAARFGPVHGWPIALAHEYLTQRMKYTLTPKALAGMRRFLEMAAAEQASAAPGASSR